MFVLYNALIKRLCKAVIVTEWWHIATTCFVEGMEM